MSSNKTIYIFIGIIVIVVGIVLFFALNGNSMQDNENSNNTARLATEVNFTENTDIDINNSEEKQVTEEEISSYSTNLSGSTENRLNNIRITCEKLNGIVVTKGNTFSFCDSTGPSTAEEGYKEATVIIDGKKEQALGGGNCQISSTLYNAVLAIPELEVVERHEHGLEVYYVPEGKDATVSYGSVDFRFKNNLSNDIKLYFETDDVTLTTRIVKLS